MVPFLHSGHCNSVFTARGASWITSTLNGQQLVRQVGELSEPIAKIILRRNQQDSESQESAIQRCERGFQPQFTGTYKVTLHVQENRKSRLFLY